MTLCPTIQGIVSAEILANYGRLSTGELTATCTQQDQVCFGLMRNTPENHGTVSGSWHDPSFCDTTNQPVEIQMSESGQHYWTSSSFQEVHPPRPHWYSAIKLAGNLHSDLSIHWSSTFCYLFLTCSFCDCLTLLFTCCVYYFAFTNSIKISFISYVPPLYNPYEGLQGYLNE